MNIKDILHTKRAKTEEHICGLEKEGKAGKRYTAIMPDILFLVLGLLCDIGWIIHLVVGFKRLIICFDLLLCLSIIVILIGVGMTVYLNKIQERADYI